MSISNVSNLDEHELIEQSKRADKQIMLLKKQVKILEERKKLQALNKE